MEKLKHDVLLRVIKILNIIMITLPFALCWTCYYSSRVADRYYWKGNSLLILLYAIVYLIYGRIYDSFLISLNRISEMVYSQSLAALITNGILYIVTWLLMKRLPNILPLFLVFGCQILLSALWSGLAHRTYYRLFSAKSSALVYSERHRLDALINEYGLDKKFDMQIKAKVEDCIQDLSILDQAEVVFLSGILSHERNIILKYCVAQNKRMYLIPRIGDVIMSGAREMHMFHLPVLSVERYAPAPEYLFVKRTFDILIALSALIVTSPVLLITAIAVKTTDHGPAFYKQVRLTKDGKEFQLLKFRSMRVDAEKDGIARLSTGEQDNRITPVGRFIRKIRIDELPQLFNILSGTMSIVGPRPERPEIARQYMEELPEFELRLQAKAGLTGYAQVYGKYNTTPYDKLQMDLMYIAHPSLAEDVKIMFATVKILFMKESTEGVTGITAVKKETPETEFLSGSTDSVTGATRKLRGEKACGM